MNKIIAEKVDMKPPRITLPRFLNSPLYYLSYIVELASNKNKMGLTSDNVDSAFKFRYFDNSKAKRELGWEPEIPFERTIDTMFTGVSSINYTTEVPNLARERKAKG